MTTQLQSLPSATEQATSLQEKISPKKKVSIRLIGPTEAKQLLETNASNQRDQRPADLTKYINAMKEGKWTDDVSAICLDKEGRLINGQHRLLAIVATGIPQEFIFAENWPHESIDNMDCHGKRSQHDRIKVGGTDMPKGADAVVRNSMTSWTAVEAGGATYNKPNCDKRVEALYKKHSDFVNFVTTKYRNSKTVNRLVLGAALHGFAQASVSHAKGKLLADPFERVKRFLDIVSEGAVMEAYNPNTDSAAMILRDWLLASRLQNRRVVGGHAYRIVVSSLNRFFKNTSVKSATRIAEACPWGPMEDLPETDLPF